MKKIKLLVLSAVTVFAVVSCQKEEIKNAQDFADKLEGTWSVTNEYYKGNEKDITDEQPWRWTFDNCKVKKGDCTGKQERKYNGSNLSWNLTYSVTGNGSAGDTIKIQGESASWTWVLETLTDSKMEVLDGNYKYVMTK